MATHITKHDSKEKPRNRRLKLPGNLQLVYGGREVTEVAQDTSHQDTVNNRRNEKLQDR